MCDSTEDNVLDKVIDPDVQKIVKQLASSLEYRQMCLDLLPEADTATDEAINKALQQEPIESDTITVPVDFVNCGDTQIRFPGIFAEDGTIWINISVIEPTPGEIVRFKLDDSTTQVCMWTKQRDLLTPIGIVWLCPTHWQPCSDQDKVDFDNLCAANKEAMENITDLYA